MISILLPTRKRPEFLKRMVNSARNTARENPEIVVYIDDDDKESVTMADELEIRRIIGPRIELMTNYWNKCYSQVGPGCDIFMQCGDDVVFKTKDWDVIVEQAFAESEDKILLVHGNDLDASFNKVNFGTHCFLHRRWIEALGYFIPPYFSSDNGDRWLMAVAEFIGRIKYVPIVTEHCHFRTGKAAIDATYAERMQRHVRDNPDQLYADMFMERLADAEKLNSIILEHQGVCRY